jgi:hypothetical protein
MDTPESMKAELAEWNNGQGIDLESWVGCEGNFRLAVGYATVFWPEFVEFDGYILGAGFSEQNLRGFELQQKGNRQEVEAMMNHIHIDGIQYDGCPDLSEDKAMILGKTLKEIYEAKLAWQFPGRPCGVEFFVPDDRTDLAQYQITFWQRVHESSSA